MMSHVMSPFAVLPRVAVPLPDPSHTCPVNTLPVLSRTVSSAVPPPLAWVDVYDEGLSFDVTQCKTTTQNRMSALQHMRQIQPGSPLRTIRTVRLTTLVVRVARDPTSEREAMRFSLGFVEFWYEYSSASTS